MMKLETFSSRTQDLVIRTEKLKLIAIRRLVTYIMSIVVPK